MNTSRLVSSGFAFAALLASTSVAVAQPATVGASAAQAQTSIDSGVDSADAVPLVKHWVKVCKNGVCKWKLVYKGKGIP